MSLFYGGKCWECKNAITKTGGSVILYCSCLTLLCQQCARNQILNQRDTYDSYIVCPLCKLTTDLKPLIMDARKAKEQEARLLKNSFDYFKLKIPSLKRATARTFHKLISLLFTSGYNDNCNLLEEKDSKIVSLKVARLELRRLQGTGKAEGYCDPLSLTFFKSNVLIEKVIMSIRGECSFSVNCNCIVCDEPIRKGKTVLLTCNCRNTHLCIYCVYQILANQEKTYSEGIHCPTCKKSSLVITGVEQAKEVELQLVTSGFKHFQIKSFKSKLNDVQELHNLYSLFSSDGLRGTADPRTFYEEEAQHIAKATTVAFLRLEIARLELMRQNNLRAPNVLQPHLFLGPMSCLRFFEHKFLNIFLEPQVLIPGSKKPAYTKRYRDEPDSIRATAATEVNLEVREVNLELAENILEAYENRDTRGAADEESSVGTIYDEEEDYESDVSGADEEEEEDQEDTDSIHSVKVRGAAARVTPPQQANGILMSLAAATVDLRSSASSSVAFLPDRAIGGVPLAYASSSSVPSVQVNTKQVKKSRPILPANSKAVATKPRVSSSGDDNAKVYAPSARPSTPPSIRKKRPLVVSDDEQDSADNLPRPPPPKAAPASQSATAVKPAVLPPPLLPLHRGEQRHAVDILRDSAMLVNVSSQLQTTSFDISAATSSLKNTSSAGTTVTAPAAPSLWSSLLSTARSPLPVTEVPRRTRFEPVYSTAALAQQHKALHRSPNSSPPRPPARNESPDHYSADHRCKAPSPPIDRHRDDHSPSRHKFQLGDRVEVFTPPDGVYEGVVRAYYDDNTYDIDTLEGRRRYDVEERMMHCSSPYGVPSSTSTSDTPRRRPVQQKTKPPPTSATWSIGDSVEVWNQGDWYPGRVKAIRGEGYFDIGYEDGMTESEVDQKYIRPPGGNCNSPNPGHKDNIDRSPDRGSRRERSRDREDVRGRNNSQRERDARGERRRSSPTPPRQREGRDRDRSPRGGGRGRDEVRGHPSSVQQYLEREIRQQGGGGGPYTSPMYDRDTYRRGGPPGLSPPRDNSSSRGINRGNRWRHRSPSPRRHSPSPSPRAYRSPLPVPRDAEPVYSSAASLSDPPFPAATSTSPAPRDLKKPPTTIVHRREKSGVKEHVLTSGIFFSYPSENEQREKLSAFNPAKLPEVKEVKNLRSLCKILDYKQAKGYVAVLETPAGRLMPAKQFMESNDVRSYRFKVKFYFEPHVVRKHLEQYSGILQCTADSQAYYCESVVTLFSSQSTVGMLNRVALLQLGFEGKIYDILGSEKQILDPKLTFAEYNILPDSTVIFKPRHFRI